MKSNKKVAAYCRVSTNMEDQLNSLSTQIKILLSISVSMKTGNLLRYTMMKASQELRSRSVKVSIV